MVEFVIIELNCKISSTFFRCTVLLGMSNERLGMGRRAWGGGSLGPNLKKRKIEERKFLILCLFLVMTIFVLLLSTFLPCVKVSKHAHVQKSASAERLWCMLPHKNFPHRSVDMVC